MGCNGSKLHPEDERVPPKVRPILRRKMEEIKRRRTGCFIKGGCDISKKELLGDPVFGEENSSEAHSVQENHQTLPPIADKPKMNPMFEYRPVTMENLVSDGVTEQPSAPSKIAKSHEDLRDENMPVERLWASKPTGNDNCFVKEKDEDEDVFLETIDSVLAEMTIVGAYENREENQEEDEGKEKDCDEEFLYPGSPSFRIYFIESLKDKIEGVASDSPSAKSQETSETVNSNEVSMRKTRKAKIRERVRKAMPRGRVIGMRTLLNVRSCYHPPCSSQDRTHLLPQKVAV